MPYEMYEMPLINIQDPDRTHWADEHERQQWFLQLAIPDYRLRQAMHQSSVRYLEITVSAKQDLWPLKRQVSMTAHYEIYAVQSLVSGYRFRVAVGGGLASWIGEDRTSWICSSYTRRFCWEHTDVEYFELDRKPGVVGTAAFRIAFFYRERGAG
jgi:hypothetical protein